MEGLDILIIKFMVLLDMEAIILIITLIISTHLWRRHLSHLMAHLQQIPQSTLRLHLLEVVLLVNLKNLPAKKDLTILSI